MNVENQTTTITKNPGMRTWPQWVKSLLCRPAGLSLDTSSCRKAWTRPRVSVILVSREREMGRSQGLAGQPNGGLPVQWEILSQK